jgi:hypothetical protein
VREEVNKLKHDIKQDGAQRGKGLLRRRAVSMVVALSAFKALTHHCRREGLI